MPRRRDHASIAFIILLIIVLIFGFKLISNWTFLKVWFCFLIGSLAPDYIEPAHHFTHRHFFHSKYLLKILSIFIIPFGIICIIFKSIILFSIFSFVLGYIGHLLLDSMTKMGLPELRNNYFRNRKKPPNKRFNP
jgi:hypothetical protein